MIGIIGVCEHRITCIIGINQDERIKEQDILIDLKVKVDFSKCVNSGVIADTIDYVAMAEMCTQLAHTKKYYLLEALAHDILQGLIEKYQAQWAWVRIKKPQAIPTAQYAMVELERYKLMINR